MADEDVKTTTDKPLSSLAAAETKVEPPAPEAEMPAVERLRTYEDKVFADSPVEVVRIGDRLERGSGSAYAALTDEQKAHYVKLEHLIAAEQKLAAAHAALLVADDEHDAALAAVETEPDAAPHE